MNRLRRVARRALRGAHVHRRRPRMSRCHERKDRRPPHGDRGERRSSASSFSLSPLPLRHATIRIVRCRGHGDLCPPSGPGTWVGVSHEPPTPLGFYSPRCGSCWPRGNSCGLLWRGPRQGEGWGERIVVVVLLVVCCFVRENNWDSGAVNGQEVVCEATRGRPPTREKRVFRFSAST